jgi:hypothetical protein
LKYTKINKLILVISLKVNIKKVTKMNKFYIILFMVLLMNNCKEPIDISKKNQYAIIQPNFINFKNDLIDSIIKEYIYEASYYKNDTIVCQLVLEQKNLTLSMKLYRIKYYSQFLDFIPTKYYLIDGNVILIVDGLQNICSFDTIYYNKLEKTIKNILEYNIDSNGVYIYNSSYDPPCWELVFKKDSILLNKFAFQPSNVLRGSDSLENIFFK